MDFAMPSAISQDLDRLRDFIRTHLTPNLSSWTHAQKIPPAFFHLMGKSGWYGFRIEGDSLVRDSAQREAAISEELAKASPGVAIAALAHVDLGLMGLSLFGSQRLHQTYGAAAVKGKTMLCLGNTENRAGSDVAGIAMSADKVDGGWILNGTKAYVTNGLIADLGVITAVSDPTAPRNDRMSMYLVDLYAEIESARLLLQKACWKIDQGDDFRLASSLAKYIAVEVAREVSLWAADIFGAASVIFEHPIHKYPLDVWAASLGEGTQDIQKLIIFRELIKNHL